MEFKENWNEPQKQAYWNYSFHIQNQKWNLDLMYSLIVYLSSFEYD